MRSSFTVLALARARSYRQQQLLAGMLGALSRSGPLLSLLAVTAMHAATAVVAYRRGGTVAAVATALLPVAAEAYWLYAFWLSYGTILNIYTAALTCVTLSLYAFGKLKPLDIHVHRW